MHRDKRKTSAGTKHREPASQSQDGRRPHGATKLPQHLAAIRGDWQLGKNSTKPRETARTNPSPLPLHGGKCRLDALVGTVAQIEKKNDEAPPNHLKKG
jgi:hypothetical protein